MSRSIVANEKKKGPGRPRTGIGPVEPLRLHPNDDRDVREFMADEPDKPKRAEALRRLVRLGIKAKKSRAGKELNMHKAVEGTKL